MAESPTTYLPDYGIQWDLKVNKVYKTEITEARDGSEQRRRVYRAGGYRALTVTSTALDQIQTETLWTFIDACDGPYLSFYAFEPHERYFAGYYAGTIAIADTQFVLPMKAVRSLSGVTVGGVAKTVTIVVGGGPGGEDKITWTGAQAGDVLLGSCYGRERFIARWQDDTVSQQFVQNAAETWANFSLVIKEVR